MSRQNSFALFILVCVVSLLCLLLYRGSGRNVGGTNYTIRPLSVEEGSTAISSPSGNKTKMAVGTPSNPHKPGGQQELKVHLPNIKTVAPVISGTKTPRTKIVYLIQTESCIPPYLKGALVDEKDKCDCDVLVLSFKTKCGEKPSTVEYIYNKSVSWSKGRNQLYRKAESRSEKYLYYVFLDDDVSMKHKEESTENPWRTFESFLRRIEPAVAAVPMMDFLQNAYKMRKKNPKCPRISPEDECLPTGRFDAAINGFHYQAIDYILPYTTLFDRVSWWYTCSYVGIKSEVIFQGHSVLLTKLRGINNKHRNYPRAKAKDAPLVKILDMIELELPKKYRNISILREWRTQGVQHEQISSSYCLPAPPPHKPIVPFELL